VDNGGNYIRGQCDSHSLRNFKSRKVKQEIDMDIFCEVATSKTDKEDIKLTQGK
jgi:hypothetical protein